MRTCVRLADDMAHQHVGLGTQSAVYQPRLGTIYTRGEVLLHPYSISAPWVTSVDHIRADDGSILPYQTVVSVPVSPDAPLLTPLQRGYCYLRLFPQHTHQELRARFKDWAPLKEVVKYAALRRFPLDNGTQFHVQMDAATLSEVPWEKAPGPRAHLSYGKGTYTALDVLNCPAFLEAYFGGSPSTATPASRAPPKRLRSGACAPAEAKHPRKNGGVLPPRLHAKENSLARKPHAAWRAIRLTATLLMAFCSLFLRLLGIGSGLALFVLAPAEGATVIGVVFAHVIAALFWRHVLNVGIPVGVRSLTLPGRLHSPEGVNWLLPGISHTGGKCIWTSFLRLGLTPSMVLSMGIAPWTTTLSRVATHRLPKVLPLWYISSRPVGHVAAVPFVGATFGLPLQRFHANSWASNDVYTPRSSFLSSPIAALGGVKATLTELVTEYESPNLGVFWKPNRYTGFTVDRQLVFSHTAGGNTIDTLRVSDFERHYPQKRHVVNNPDTFTDTLCSILFFKVLKEDSHAVAAQYEVKPWLSPASTRGPSLQVGELGGLFEGATTKDALKMAQESVAGLRFMGSRGDRVINGWQAEDRPRGLGLSSFAQSAASHVDYREPAFRLFSRYLAALAQEEYSVWAGTLPAGDARKTNVTFAPRSTGNTAQITFIHAGPPVGVVPPVTNPEAPMWTDAAQIGLKSGRKQFVDAQDLSEDELIELLSAIDPTDSSKLLNLTYGPMTERSSYRHPLSRYYYPSGIDEIFVHTGLNANQYDSAAQQRIKDSLHRAPHVNSIATVLRLLAVRHGAESALLFGAEMAIYRSGVSDSARLPGTRANAPLHRYPGSDGNWELHLPRTYTSLAYFDTFLTPGMVPLEVDGLLNLQSREVVNNVAIVTHARLVSLNWASFAQSMVGRNWVHRPNAETDRRIFQWINILSRTFSFDKVTDWSTTHANAMAIQYGYAPSVSVRSTEAGWIQPFWADWVTPTFNNHYLELWAMEFIPTFQLLPFFDPELGSSHTPWPADTPRPLMARESFSGQVLLGRDSPLFAPQAWKQSGGPQYAAQFYAAAGCGSSWRFAGHTLPMQLMRMRQERVDRFRQAPAGQNPVWMQPAGQPFADFLLPGTINCWNFSTHNSYDWGVELGQSTDKLNLGLQLDRWRDAANQEPHTSLMINYIHPVRDHRQLETMLDYSTVILERGNTYSGLVLVKHLMPNYELDERFSPKAPAYQQIPVDIPQHAPGNTPPEGTRVAANRAAFGTPAAKFVNRSISKQPEHEPHLSYHPKNPETLDDLPPLETHSVTAENDGIHLDDPDSATKRLIDFERPIYLEGADSGYDYEAEQERTSILDSDLKQFLAEQAAKQARAQSEREERQLRLAAQAKVHAKRPTRTPSRSSLKETRVAPAVTSVPLGHYIQRDVQGKFPVTPTESVEPNDSEAGSVQARALQQADAIVANYRRQLAGAHPPPSAPKLKPILTTSRAPRVSALPQPRKTTVRFASPPSPIAEAAEVAPAPRESPVPLFQAPTPLGDLDWDGNPAPQVAGSPLEQAQARTDSANRLAYRAEAASDPENYSGTQV